MPVAISLSMRVVAADRRSGNSLRRQSGHTLQVCVRHRLSQDSFRRRRLLCFFRLLLFAGRAAARQRPRRYREGLQRPPDRRGGPAVHGLPWAERRIVGAGVGAAGVARRAVELQVWVVHALRTGSQAARRRRARVGGGAARVLLGVVVEAELVVRATPEAAADHVEKATIALAARRRRQRGHTSRFRHRNVNKHHSMLFHWLIHINTFAFHRIILTRSASEYSQHSNSFYLLVFCQLIQDVDRQLISFFSLLFALDECTLKLDLSNWLLFAWARSLRRSLRNRFHGPNVEQLGGERIFIRSAGAGEMWKAFGDAILPFGGAHVRGGTENLFEKWSTWFGRKSLRWALGKERQSEWFASVFALFTEKWNNALWVREVRNAASPIMRPEGSLNLPKH